jgi:prolyl oligopeptidase
MLPYPAAPHADVSDNFFGTLVADPYRPLEDIDAPQTRAWLDEQRALTAAYFSALPERAHIRATLEEIVNFERTGIPSHENGTYVVERNSGLQNQAVVYTMHGERGAARVLLDPNLLSSDGTVAVAGASLSPDGTRYAYALQQSGSDWQTWHVRDVATGADLPDRVEWARFSGASWSRDNAGFYYSRYDEPSDPSKLDIAGDFQKIYFHKLGTAQSEDALVYERPDIAKMYVWADVTEDGRYLVFTETLGGVKNGLVVRDLHAPESADVRLFPPDLAHYEVVDNDGSRLFLFTTDGAPKGRLVAIDLTQSQAMHEIVGETGDTLESVSSCGGRFFLTYLQDAHSRVLQFDRTGAALGEIALPGIGTAGGFYGHRDDSFTYYAFSTYVAPSTIYRYDIATGTTTAYASPRSSFDSASYVTEQRFATSKDGTLVPVFITHHRDAPRDGSVRTILYGYGGFDINLTPAFSATVATWLSLGGSYAVANLRGGGEYGQAWHEAGMREHKQNVFDDFAAVARMLVCEGYTSHERLALSGGSNGGLLVAATLTQQPALASAVLCDVGVMDMLRFHRFTVGAGWIPEYGCADASEEEFRTLFAYSPLANVKAGTHYPATLVSTGDHDDRVFPAHSFKFAAALQAAQAGPAPILLFIESDAGHGAGKPLAKTIEETANRFAFLSRVLSQSGALNATI